MVVELHELVEDPSDEEVRIDLGVVVDLEDLQAVIDRAIVDPGAEGKGLDRKSVV